MKSKKSQLEEGIAILTAVQATFKKKSAADIEALRWREMFQAALACPLHHGSVPETVDYAASVADLGLHAFYSRYEREK